MKKTLVLILAISILSTALLSGTNFFSVKIVSDKYYDELDVMIREYDLLDIGVVDANSDNRLDIFTVNHSARQSLLLNEGEGRFRDILSSLGLDQDRRFPGLEDTLEKPEIDKPGLYIFRTSRWLHIRAHAINRNTPANGTMEIPWPVSVRTSPPAFKVSEKSDLSGAISSTIEFSLYGDQAIVLNGAEDIVEIPHGIKLDAAVDLGNVYVGINLVRPHSHVFDLVWRDRHAMAWADYDGDGDIDVFINRGGLKGQLDNFPLPITDELLAGTDDFFVDQTRSSDLRKGNCPSRQASWIDFDGDGDLDIYVSCGRGTNSIFPNQLFRQEADHRFVDIAAEQGLDFAYASVFAWVDSDSDNDMDLLSIEDGRLFHYLNDGGEFEKRAVGTDLAGAKPYKLAIADYDNDGDFDAFAVHGAQSFLVLNANGRFSLQLPSSIGLPDRGRTANWIDFDNDGLTDLHIVPGGLYRQSPDHRFRESDILAYRGRRSGIVDARSTWFDVDNDGYRDVILAVQSGPDLWQRILRKFAGRTPNLSSRWQSSFFQSVGPRKNHWLQIQLHGSTYNRQAIGARAYVTTSDRTQLQQVGSAEGSHFSQGHYRLYYGIGENTMVDDVMIEWPDGRTQRRRNIQADQLLHITYSKDR